MNNYLLSIDPSGIGTTCIYYYPNKNRFENINSNFWK